MVTNATRASVAFFDGIGTAHSLPLVAGLDGAAARRGIRRSWASALRPAGDVSVGADWTEIRSFYQRYCETGEFSAIAYRQVYREALERAAKSGASFFCDLAAEMVLESWGLPIRVRIPSVWVVHQVPHPPRAGGWLHRSKYLVANRRKWKAEARLVHQRNVLRRLSRAGGRFVVHTDGARERLGRIVPSARIELASWPIVSESSPPALAAPSGEQIIALFPGEARVGKGLSILLSALPYIDGVDVFDLPTVVTAEAQLSVRNARDDRLRMGTEWLTNDAYQSHLCAASLAVLPYRTEATANAGISASLLDALAVGLPAVITEPIARGLPPNYGGAIVVPPNSAAALAAGIHDALGRLDELRAAAREEGPPFVVKHHSYEQYLDTLVALGTS
jgi:hypothetical protein